VKSQIFRERDPSDSQRRRGRDGDRSRDFDCRITPGTELDPNGAGEEPRTERLQIIAPPQAPPAPAGRRPVDKSGHPTGRPARRWTRGPARQQASPLSV